MSGLLEPTTIIPVFPQPKFLPSDCNTARILLVILPLVTLCLSELASIDGKVDSSELPVLLLL